MIDNLDDEIPGEAATVVPSASRLPSAAISILVLVSSRFLPSSTSLESSATPTPASAACYV